MICGQLHFEEASENLLIAALPEMIVLHAGEQSLMDRFGALMVCIRDELDRNDAGALAIATDLASAMFMMMLRQHLASYPPVEGLLALLGQRATAKVIIAMLRDPSHEWTLDQLAAQAAVSRATLIRSFERNQVLLRSLSSPSSGLLSLGGGWRRHAIRSARLPLMSAIVRSTNWCSCSDSDPAGIATTSSWVPMAGIAATYGPTP
jgi:AraC family transcriptional regulator, activator of mtrCDE